MNDSFRWIWNHCFPEQTAKTLPLSFTFLNTSISSLLCTLYQDYRTNQFTLWCFTVSLQYISHWSPFYTIVIYIFNIQEILFLVPTYPSCPTPTLQVLSVLCLTLSNNSILTPSCHSLYHNLIWVIFTQQPFNSVQFSSVQSLSHVQLFATPWIAARQPSCPSPTPRVYPNSCASSQWCHPAISSSAIPF